MRYVSVVPNQIALRVFQLRPAELFEISELNLSPPNREFELLGVLGNLDRTPHVHSTRRSGMLCRVIIAVSFGFSWRFASHLPKIITTFITRSFSEVVKLPTQRK